MPEISRFYGINITMFGDDHNPPHLHIRYGDYQALVTLEEHIIKGEMPKHVLKKVFKWMEIHQSEIVKNWKRLQAGTEAQKIAPLD